MTSIVSVRDLRKAYKGGFEALKGVNLEIEEGEILALLGPNGAGKTTLISTICGITVPTGGNISVGGHDTRTDYRKARGLIGLVPQEINLEPFETVMNTVRFSRGLFGKPSNDALIEQILKDLSRVGIISKGQILLVQDKADLMAQMGQKQLHIELSAPLDTVPDALSAYDLAADGHTLTYTYDTRGERTGITALLNDLQKAGLQMIDIKTAQSSLEDIFVGLVKEDA